MKQQKIRFKGQIGKYITWPVWLSIIVALFNIIMFFVNVKAGFVMLIFTALYVATALILYYKNKSVIVNDLVSFATQYGQVQDVVIPSKDKVSLTLTAQDLNTDKINDLAKSNSEISFSIKFEND